MSESANPGRRLVLEGIEGDGGRLSLRTDGLSVDLELTGAELADLEEQLAALHRSRASEAAPSPRQTPAPLPKPVAAPVFSTSSEGEDGAPTKRRGPLRILQFVRPHMERIGVTDRDVAAVVEDPEDEWIDDTGTKSVLVGDQIGVVLGLPDEVVVSVQPKAWILKTRPKERDRRRGRGGNGSQYPTTMRELHDVLAERGIIVEPTGGGHKQARRGGKCYTIAATPSDHHSLMNMIKGIERELEVDLRRSAG